MQDPFFEDTFYTADTCRVLMPSRSGPRRQQPYYFHFILNDLDGQYFTQNSVSPFKPRSMVKNTFSPVNALFFPK